MDSPRLGGRGRGSARGTPRMGTPSGSIGGYPTPAARGSLTLGKSKGRLRAGLDYGNMSGVAEQSHSMILSREGSYDVGEAEAGAPRMGNSQLDRRGGEKGKIFAKSEEITASLHEGLPLDVVKYLGLNDAWKETYAGGYNTATGYTWLASGLTTWIWKHHRNPPTPPTVHIFASPTSTGELSPPQVIFVPLQSNATNEPALLLISPSGSIRFWSSIFLGLAGADRFVEEKLTMNRKGTHAETVTMAQALIPSLSLSTNKVTSQAVINPDIVAVTSHGRIFRIVVSRRGDGGDWSIATKSIYEKSLKSGGLFSGFFGFGSSSAGSRFGMNSSSNGISETAGKLGDDTESINAVAMGAVGVDGIDVWILGASNLAIWRVSDNLAQTSSNSNALGMERLVCKADAISGIQQKLLEQYDLADYERSTAEDRYAEGSAIGVSLPGGPSEQMERQERRTLALGVELLDFVLVKSKGRRAVDPREPSTSPGSRNEDKMESEMAGEIEELTPIILVAYNAPSGHSGDTGGISWQSASASRKRGPERQQLSYATIACRFIGIDRLAGGQATPVQTISPILTFESISLLPYSDLVSPRPSDNSRSGPGVSIGLGVGKSPGAKEGWFAPRLAALQATVVKAPLPEGEDDSDEEDLTMRPPQEKSITVLVATFEGGMVFATNDGPFKDHVFMKQSHPFPRSLGFGVVGGNPKLASSYLPYSLSAARLSSSALGRPSSRSQMLPPLNSQYLPKPPLAEVVYLTTMGIVSVSLDFEKIASVDERSGGSNQIRSVMEQAILYGPVPDNPFAFRFSSNINAGNLMVAAGQLSLETMQSNPKFVKKQLGLTTHLADRAARLEWLIQFINENGALGRLNMPLRSTLATHAEKIAAAQGVWAWYDGTRFKGPATAAGVGSLGLERSQNMLVQAVDIFQQEEESGEGWPNTSGNRRRSGQRAGDILASPTSSVAAIEPSFGSDDEPGGNLGMSWSHVQRQAQDIEAVKQSDYVDPVRVFFKVKVEDIGELVPCSVKVVKATVNSFDKSQAWPDVTAQAGRLTLVLLEAALQFRKNHASAYGIDPDRPAGTPWTSEQRILDACVYLFEECGRTGADTMAAEAKDVMEGLATVICEGYKEQLAAARLRPGADWETLRDRFIVVRRDVWRLLVQRGASPHAFKLAEDHGDFKALTDLCYQHSTKKKQKHGGETKKVVDQKELATKLDHYINHFKQEFAFELYHWWIEKGMAHEIFKQTERHVDYVESFFSTFEYPHLAWLHQMGKSQFSAASATLLNLAQSDPRLGPVKFLLSMGKLCELVEFDGNGDGDQDETQGIDEQVQEFDELLNLVDVQQKLRKDLLETVTDVDISRALNVADVGSQHEDLLTKAAIITDRVTTQLSEAGFTENITLFKRLVGNIIGDKRLGVEDTLDLLGLKDNALQTWFSVALHLVSETLSLADARKEVAIRTLWRRVYICDNWKDLHDTRSYTDAQVNERLRSASLFAALRTLYTGSLTSILDTEELAKLIRRPSEALEIPTEEELMERFAQSGYYGDSGYIRYTKADISALYAELEKEKDILDDYANVLEGAGLWEEVARLEESERPWEGNGLGMTDTCIDMRGNSLGIDVSMGE